MLRLALALDAGDGPLGGDDDDQGERDVDVEGPAPGELVGEEPSEQGPEHGGDAEDRAECSLVTTALAQRDDVGDQRRGGDRQATRTDPLDGPGPDQPLHAAGQAAQCGSDDEDGDAGLEDELASEQVAELAGDGRGDRLRQQVGRHHPRDMVAAAEVADDGRQRRRDDRAVEGREQHPQGNGRERDGAASAVENVRPLRATLIRLCLRQCRHQAPRVSSSGVTRTSCCLKGGGG